MSATRTTQDWAAVEAAHSGGSYPKRPLTLVRGEGVYAYDPTGTRYIDATSGQGVALLGHCHPAVTAAVQQQAATLVTCPEIFHNDQRATLYQTLQGVLPADLNRFFLCNSGAEAVEGALKVSRLLTGRERVVAAKSGFHGRTLGALSLTWNKKYREPFEGWNVPTTHVPYNDTETTLAAIDETVAAVMLEAVQGEGGVNPADADYLRAVADRCREVGALLIVDEIQTGFGRTGRWFAFQHAGVTPDIVTLGKGIAGGLPMGAVVWRGALGTIPSGSHGSTFGGNPLASAAAVATVQALMQIDAPARAAEMGAWTVGALRALDHPQVREVRGLGLLIGLELRGRVTPALKALQQNGVLALPAGPTVLRLLPPLTIERDVMAQVIDAVAGALDSVGRRSR